MHPISLLALPLLFLALHSRADTADCPHQLERSAAEAIPNVADWAALHDAYRRYRHCDDGGIGESFSDRVTELLATKWDTLPQFGQLASKDPQFAQFVIRHIDETADDDKLRSISTKARAGCPGLGDAMCKQIQGSAEAALKALRSLEEKP